MILNVYYICCFDISDLCRYKSDNVNNICFNCQPSLFKSNNFFKSKFLYPNSHSTTKLKYSNIRQISYTSSLFSEKPSKIEETVNTIKEKAQKEANGKEVAVVKPKKTIKQKIVDELIHYYHGFKLLELNVKISSKLALKKMRGVELTRREHNLVN